jgi:predicted transglutaminase-like protease
MKIFLLYFAHSFQSGSNQNSSLCISFPEKQYSKTEYSRRNIEYWREKNTDPVMYLVSQQVLE